MCVSPLNWDGHQVCEQNITRQLALHNTVLYVERPVSFMTPFTRSGRGKTLKQLKRWLKGGIRKEEGLLIASPPPFLPLRFTFLANIVNQMVMTTWLRRLIRKYDMKDLIVITFEPDSARLREKLKEKLFVYYCDDDHEAKGFWWNRRQSIIKKERELIRKSNLVFCLTEGFASTRRAFNKNMHVLPNGVDENFIKLCFDHSHDAPADMAPIRRPIIGFFGMIDSRLDARLLMNIAKKRKDWSFVLVGPICGKLDCYFEDLCNLPNVYHLGGKRREEFALYIRAMDVCLIPIIVSDRTRNVLSLKLFEYAALGKPIVSTDLPELRRYAKFVNISRNVDEFHTNIDNCLKYWSDEQSSASINFASLNTWEHRAQDFSLIIQSHMLEKTSENNN